MKTRIIVVLLVLGLFGATGANAAFLQLDATSTDPDHSDFVVVFDDAGDGLLQEQEVTLFSGLNIFSDATLYEVLLGVPTIAGVSTQSGFCPLADHWCFLAPDIGLLVGVSQDTFTYAISRSVAEPGTVGLLIVGLLGLTRRRTRRVSLVEFADASGGARPIPSPARLLFVTGLNHPH